MRPIEVSLAKNRHQLYREDLDASLEAVYADLDQGLQELWRADYISEQRRPRSPPGLPIQL